MHSQAPLFRCIVFTVLYYFWLSWLTKVLICIVHRTVHIVWDLCGMLCYCPCDRMLAANSLNEITTKHISDWVSWPWCIMTIASHLCPNISTEYWPLVFNLCLFDTARAAGSMSVWRYLFICLSVPLTAAAACGRLVLWARRAGSIARQWWPASAEAARHTAAWHSAANASSAMLSADVVSWTQTCCFSKALIWNYKWCICFHASDSSLALDCCAHYQVFVCMYVICRSHCLQSQIA